MFGSGAQAVCPVCLPRLPRLPAAHGMAAWGPNRRPAKLTYFASTPKYVITNGASPVFSTECRSPA